MRVAQLVHLIVNRLHPLVKGCNVRRDALQFVGNVLRNVLLRLVAELMLQRSPEVHGNRANLHLDGYKNPPFGEKNRNFDN